MKVNATPESNNFKLLQYPLNKKKATRMDGYCFELVFIRMMDHDIAP